MRRSTCVFCLLLLLCAAGAAAESSLLPDRFGPWQAEGPANAKSGPSLYVGWGGVRLDGLREAGLAALEQRSYKNGNEELKLTLYTFKDPSGAYQFYTQGLAPEMRSAGLGDESAFDQNNGAILVGNLVVSAGSLTNLKPESLLELVTALKAKADITPFPPLRGYLPAKWRVFGTEKYAQGPEGFRSALNSLGLAGYSDLSKEVGFQSGAEVILAKYQGMHGSGTLLLLEYPTPQLAEQHLRHLEEALPTAAKQAGVTVERKASLLSLVFAPSSAVHAQAIRDEVNYETEVTWNEPHQTITDPPIFSMMAKIFVFTGLFLLVATVLGIAFGGARILTKRLLPGKVFDRPQDIEVLQLGLSGKKIDPTDMY
jgi:hypothetical protein